MVSPFYLAMTSTEFSRAAPLPEHSAWMACHFSPYGTGLSNKPKALPKGNMLILNDLIPWDHHNPEQVAEELQALVDCFSVRRLLLDLERPGVADVPKMIDCILKKVSCSIGISHHYAVEGYPVFVPPTPPDMPAEKYLQPWKNHKIWLEITAEPLCLEITEKGCQEAIWCQEKALPEHWNDALFCHYQIYTQHDRIQFLLYRKEDALQGFLERLAPLGVECAVGLYQEFNKRKTALHL